MKNIITFDYRKLKGRIKEKFETQQNFVNNIDMCDASFRKKIQNNSSFSQTEIINICKILDIKIEDIPLFFYTTQVR